MQREIATFAAGCFWSVEATFRNVTGVIDVVVGYSSGAMENPSYEQVCTGGTGHAESVQLTYNPSIVSYQTLLDTFWNLHDPTTLNRQGPDVGSQYRSVIFYHTEQQKKFAADSKKILERSNKFENSVVTEIIPAAPFYKAEDYHQRYFEKRGRAVC